MCCAAAASLWLTPWSIREEIRIKNVLIASELTADVHPRVFEEQFPNKVLYVGDVIVGPPSRWRQIFVADVTPPGERGPSASERGDNPVISLAPEAIAVPDPSANRLQLTLENGSTYEVGKDRGDYHIEQYSGRSDQAPERGETEGGHAFETGHGDGHRAALQASPIAPRSWTRRRSSTRRLS